MIDAIFATTLGITGEGGQALAALRTLPVQALLGDVGIEAVYIVVREELPSL
jgi:hypothetical protein